MVLDESVLSNVGFGSGMGGVTGNNPSLELPE